MDTKNILIVVAVVIIAVGAVAGYVFTTGMLNSEPRQTTDFSCSFMEGKFTDNVTLVNNSTYLQSWKDDAHHIEYNISTIENSTEIFEIQDAQSMLANGGMSGFVGPEKRTFNGNEWKIYFTQGISTDNSSGNKTMNIIICECQGKNQGYLIYMVFDNSSDVGFRLSPFCDAYENYTEPLLKSISLKESGAPHNYEELGLSESDYKQQIDIVHQIRAGNFSAVQEANQ